MQMIEGFVQVRLQRYHYLGHRNCVGENLKYLECRPERGRVGHPELANGRMIWMIVRAEVPHRQQHRRLAVQVHKTCRHGDLILASTGLFKIF